MKETDARRWLRQHGFMVSRDGRHYQANYTDRDVHIEVVGGIGESYVMKGRKKTLLRFFHVADLRLDQYGMLHGAGIDNYFRDLMTQGRYAPAWFPKSYQRTVELSTLSKKENNGNWKCSHQVIEWCVDNDFEEVAYRMMGREIEGMLTEVEVGIDRVTLTAFKEGSQFSVREVTFKEADYDPAKLLDGLFRKTPRGGFLRFR